MAKPKQATARLADSGSTFDRIFTLNYDEEEEKWIFELDSTLSIPERKRRALQIPTLVQTQRLLTKLESDGAGVYQLLPDTVYWVRSEYGMIPVFFQVTIEWIKTNGFHDEFLCLRERWCHKDTKPTLAKICKEQWSEHEKKRGTVYQAGPTFQTGMGVGRIQLSAPTRRGNEWDGHNTMRGTASMVSRMCDKWNPTAGKNGQKKRQRVNAALLPFSTDNNHFTNSQINFAGPEQSLTKANGKFGHIHIDKDDDPTELTAMPNFSNLPEDQFHGYLNLTPLRAICPMRPGCVMFFNSTFFHMTSAYGPYSVPLDSPLRLPRASPDLLPDLLPREEYPYGRCTMPFYADTKLWKPTFECFQAELFSEAGVKGFENEEHQSIWMMNTFIVNEAAILSRTASRSPDEDLRGMGPELIREALSTYPWKDRDPKKMYASGARARLKARKRAERAEAVEQAGSSTEEEDDDLDITRIVFELQQQKYEEQAIRITRAYDADWYTNLFAWKVEITVNGKTTWEWRYPPREEAQAIIDALRSPGNLEFDILDLIAKSFHCGVVFKDKDLKWTHDDYEPEWDDTKDSIPGNPDWKYNRDGEALQELVRKSKVEQTRMRTEAIELGQTKSQLKACFEEVASLVRSREEKVAGRGSRKRKKA